MKSMIERADPALLQALGITETPPADPGFSSDAQIAQGRELHWQATDQMLASMGPFEGVDIQDFTVTSYDDAAIDVRVYRPADAAGVLPVIFWIHGGGYVFGKIAQDDPSAVYYAKSLPCIVVSVGYRLAPEFPFPAALEDCYAALKWVHDNAAEQQMDPAKIALYGVSAGAGLAAGLTQLARDRGEMSILFQMLAYPMLDDRNITQIDDPEQDTLLWTSAKNRTAWRAYLGQEPGGENTPLYAAPGRTENLADLPPAYIYVGELDLFLNEDVAYAGALIQAGVSTELHVFKRSTHGFDFFGPETDAGRRCRAGIFAALQNAFEISPGHEEERAADLSYPVRT